MLSAQRTHIIQIYFLAIFHMLLQAHMKALSGHIRPVGQSPRPHIFMCHPKRMAALNYLQKFSNFHQHKPEHILVFLSLMPPPMYLWPLSTGRNLLK